MIYNWLTPNGRIGRSEYWLTMLVHTVAVAYFTWLFLGRGNAQPPNAGYLNEALLLGAGAWLSFCNIAKRLHDRDKPAWYYLLSFVPFANFWLIVIECGLRPGTKGPNRFGPGRVASQPDFDLPGAKFVPLPRPVYAPPPKRTLNDGIAGAIAAKAAWDAQRFGRRR